MIDIHSHIIPELDDGSSSMEESIKMLKIAINDGITDIVTTPHIYSNHSKYKDPEKIQEKFNEFKEKINQSDLKIKIFQGAEVFFTSSLREQLNTQSNILTINNGDYFLLEFPLDFIFPGTKEFMFDIMTDGFIPIICHPERNKTVQKNPDLLYQFLQIGALSQINAGSLKGDLGSDAYFCSLNLLKLNLVHIIATDCHNAEYRIPELSFVYDKLKDFERERIDMLVEKIPRAIINNNAIPDIGPTIDPEKKSTFFSIFRKKIQ